MLYKYKNYVLDTEDGKARFYVDGRLMFKGDGYIGIQYIHLQKQQASLKLF